jgi:hypothetical protein
MPRAKKPNPRARHRPQKNIDWEEVDKYLLAQVPGTWIASAIGVHPDTLYIRCEIEKGMTFSAYSQSKKEHGKAIGMIKQFQGMLKGNTQLTLHFAAHHLGQVHKAELKQQINADIKTLEIIKPLVELPDNEHSYPVLRETETESTSGPAI